MRRPRALLAALLLPAGLVGCLGVERLDDVGMVCLGEVSPWDTGAALSVAAGEELPVTVVFSPCASGSVEWRDQSCSVLSTGGEVTVSASAKTRTPRSTNDDCNWVDLDCGSVTLDEGAHTLVFGEESVSFEVPYDGPTICVESR